MNTDVILELLNRAATIRLVAHCRGLVDRSIFELTDWDILKGVVYVE